MKTKFTLSILFIFASSFYLFGGFTISSVGESNSGGISAGKSSVSSLNDENPFLIGALHNGADYNFEHTEELGFNVWHTYTDNNGWVLGDSIYADISTYGDGVRSRLNAISSFDMRSVIMRPKIALLCYGQRSDYQCEDIPSNDDLWFYSFQSPDHVGVDIDDNWQGKTQRVRYCEVNPHTTDGGAGWVVSRLKANTEQCHSYSLNSSIKDDAIKNWIIKPRIRIDSTFADNPVNWNTEVCKIIVVGQSGIDTLLESNIRVIKFLNGSNNYGGRYLEEFNNLPSGDSLTISGFWGNWWGNGARGNSTADTANQIDIQVYWYGNCDMWIDYVRVDNMMAHDLLRGVYDNTWLEWEAADIACYNESAIKFYIELFEFSNIPCMSYVSRKLDSIALASCQRSITLTGLFTHIYSLHVPWENRFTVLNADHITRNYVEKVGLKDFLVACYPFFADKQIFPYNNTTFSKIPNTLPVTSGEGILAYAISQNDYDTWLQNNLDHSPSYLQYGSSAPFPHDSNAYQWEGAYRWYMALGDSISKANNIPFWYNAQAHLWYYAHGESHKEPTNEEIEMLANLSLTYGVKSLLYFMYGWWHGPDPLDSNQYCPNDECYGRGFADPDNVPRIYNAYGQEKWEMIKGQVERLKSWETYIMSFDNENRKSYIYYFPDARNEMSSTTFINELKAFPPVEFAPPYYELDEWLSENPPDTANKTYLQAAFFNKPNDTEMNKYFMIVNRRCSPYVDSANLNNLGGRRLVTIKINPSQLPGFNNWKVINIEDSSIVATFDKNTTNQIYIGDFMPGQGKLFRVAPVMQEGGTLVANEEVTGVNITCKGMVYGDGHDITINSGTIGFENSAGLYMEGGNFICGQWPSEEITLVELKGKDASTFWHGIELNECEEVNIFKTKFKNIAPQRYAVTMGDCFDFNISSNTFLINDAIKVGAVSVDYLLQTRPLEILAFFNYNNITINSSIFQSFRAHSYGSANIPLMMNGNTFTAQTGSTAIGLFNIGEAVIKNNTISNYSTGVSIFGPASYADLYSGNITSGLTGSKGIVVTEGSVNLGSNGTYHTGGQNEINVTGDEGNSIELENGYFNINRGENTFNVVDINLAAFHFAGIFQYETGYEAAEVNCFKFDSQEAQPNHNVINPDSYDPVNFDFDPASCPGEGPGEFEVFALGGGESDTVYMESSGGTGGAFPSTFVIPADLSTEALAQVELYNEINIEMRKRNYENAYGKCNDFLDLYIGDERSLNVLSKLYMSSLMIDSAGSIMNPLKTYFENLILSQGSNEKLVRKTFYLLQKCKASLGMYSDAMSGFQQIINQNPYSYLGLAAKWDYMAVHLLDSLSGIGGGLPDNTLETEFKLFDDKPREINLRSDYDKKFDAVQREQINNNIKRSLTGSREEQVEAVKELVKKVQQSDKRSAIELDKRNRLNESVTIRKPKDMMEHRNIIREDIEKVFATAESLSGIKENLNIIPTTFELYQNFPNPFNPATKIKFDLPQNAKVSLKIYDILGRELTKMVNNSILEAGVHTYDFNAASFASGVYFYRIESIDPGSNSVLFVKTKKMILLR